jgi:hypothetical protein
MRSANDKAAVRRKPPASHAQAAISGHAFHLAWRDLRGHRRTKFFASSSELLAELERLQQRRKAARIRITRRREDGVMVITTTVAVLASNYTISLLCNAERNQVSTPTNLPNGVTTRSKYSKPAPYSRTYGGGAH